MLAVVQAFIIQYLGFSSDYLDAEIATFIAHFDDLCNQEEIMKEREARDAEDVLLSLGTSMINVKGDDRNPLHPSEERRNAALCYALCNILHQARSGASVLVATLKHEAISAVYPKSLDTLGEIVVVSTCSDYDSLLRAVTDSIGDFKSSLGCILFILSLCLTRGVDVIKSDMDDKDGKFDR